MRSVAWKVGLVSVALVCLSKGWASGQQLRQPDPLPLPPPPSTQPIVQNSTDNGGVGTYLLSVRQASTISYMDEDPETAGGSTTVSDDYYSARRTGGWSDRSQLKLKSVAQTTTNPTPLQPTPANPPQTMPAPAPANQNTMGNFIIPPGQNCGANPYPLPPGPAPNCGPPCGPIIPYVPYTSQQAPFAPAFCPCPYYPPCYCYSGQLCATSPCLCPPPCCQPPGQAGYGQIVNGQWQNNGMLNGTNGNGQPTYGPNDGQNGQPANGQPANAQPTGTQSSKMYPVRRTSAYMDLDDSGTNGSSPGSINNGPPPPNVDNNGPPVPPKDTTAPQPPRSTGNNNGGYRGAGAAGNDWGPNGCTSCKSGSYWSDECGAGQCTAGQCSAAQCNSGSCSSCQCNSAQCNCGNSAQSSAPTCSSCNCDSAQCDSCRHKCHPLIQFDECNPLKCEDDPTNHLFGDCCCLKDNDITITGWNDAGIMGNGRNTADNFNGPLTFPDRNGEGQENQLWLSVDRTAPSDNCGWFIGGHLDFFFGSDYFFTTAAGLDGTSNGNTPRWNTDPNSLYGFAMPQLYVETDYDNDWKIKWGHFFTIIGYETVPAIGNFFYSHSYTMQYGEPFTHTGALVTKTSDNWSWSGGIVGGWNTFEANERAAWLGGVTYSDKDWGSLAFSVITGQDSTVNLPGVGPFANRTMYSLVWSRNFTSRFTYVIQHDMGDQNDAVTARGGGAQWYGINQYLFYKLNCCWTAGMRIEWFRDDDGFVVNTARPGNADDGASFPGNFYEITLGLNYKPNGNLAIRPEVRWDWYDGEQNQSITNPPVTSPFNAGNSNNQFTFGVDLVTQW